MRILLFLFLLIFSGSVQAQELYAPTPQCAQIKNETKDDALVEIRTDYYLHENGAKDYYETILRLKPDESREVCAKGPFYPDYKVNLTIKSLFPLFDCRTKLTGEIPIRERKAAGGGRDFYAVCAD